METRKGRIVKGLGGLYEILTPQGAISCRAKGAFRHQKEAPAVGDLVTVAWDAQKGGVIEAIEPRKNILIRPPLANIDMLFCILPTKDPAPDLFTLDKLIAIAESLSIQPVIVITKGDLDREESERLAAVYQKTYPTFLLALDEEEGVAFLRQYLLQNAKDKISAFAGVSGAGKSTLVNRLFPALSLQTGTVSPKIGRGRHTTRHVELFPLSSLFHTDGQGFLADTPGFSMLDFQRFDFFSKEELPYTFREFSPYFGRCRYTRCTHLCEEGCAIVEAVARGDIPQSRHESYVTLYGILKNKNPWDKK